MNALEKLMLAVLAVAAIVALPQIVEKTVSEWEPQPDAHARIRAAVKASFERRINQ